ncbi:hypothetical protein E2C01_002141 [Portunus trituberculatus]|uniref:Uncharacterized protein n=1 Tax=Portunus trituberculatus TaxID=210409 RepID=A0A5B7CIY9_PORTR|nr:hypothetical protein [Portunus trituberculatus]
MAGISSCEGELRLNTRRISSQCPPYVCGGGSGLEGRVGSKQQLRYYTVPTRLLLFMSRLCRSSASSSQRHKFVFKNHRKLNQNKPPLKLLWGRGLAQPRPSLNAQLSGGRGRERQYKVPVKLRVSGRLF